MNTTLRICTLLLPLTVLLAGWCCRPAIDRRTPHAIDQLHSVKMRSGVVAGGLMVLVFGGWKLVVVSGVVVLSARRVAPRRRRVERRRRLLGELPEVVDFYRVALGGGHTPLAATEVVAHRLDGAVAGALAERLKRVELGARFADELETLPVEVGEELRGLSRVLVSTERHGVPATAALEQLSAEVRLERRREAEIAARRLPVKLLFPLVACTLPAFVLLTVVPVVVTSFQSIATP